MRVKGTVRPIYTPRLARTYRARELACQTCADHRGQAHDNARYRAYGAYYGSCSNRSYLDRASRGSVWSWSGERPIFDGYGSWNSRSARIGGYHQHSGPATVCSPTTCTIRPPYEPPARHARPIRFVGRNHIFHCSAHFCSARYHFLAVGRIVDVKS